VTEAWRAWIAPAPETISVPTTSAAVANRALEALDGSGVRFALLHNEDRLAAGETPTDVDVIVHRPVDQALRGAVAQLHRRGLRPILVWPYDVGSLTVFLSDATANEGLQLDLLSDPAGHGKYGLRTAEVLRASVAGARWPVLDPLDALVYQLRKRSIKGQGARVAELLENAPFTTRDIRDRGRHILSPHAAYQLAALLGGRGAVAPASAAAGLERMRRLVRRAVLPIGFWAHLPDPAARAVAARIAERLDRIVVRADVVPGPSTAAAARWYLRRVAPVRWRPGIVISVGGATPRPAPDLTVGPRSTGSAEELIPAVVTAMCRRTSLRWHL
jgi:hypothetical protein